MLLSLFLTLAFVSQEIEKNDVICPQGYSTSLKLIPRGDKGTGYAFRIPNYEINCTNVHEIALNKRIVGHGVSKRTYRGKFRGRRVAVKMVTMQELYSKDCIEDGLDKTKPDHVCYRLSNMKLMKEILMVQQLDHQSLMTLLGFCLRSEETKGDDMSTHGLVAVYQYAQQLLPRDMACWTLQTRLKKAVELFDLFDYFQHSPIGSIQFPDLKLAHFLWADNRIKVHDFDDVNIKEPPCVNGTCEYGAKCVQNACVGYAHRMNLWKINFEFSRYFYPAMYFDDVPVLKELSEDLASNTKSPHDMKIKTVKLLELLPQIEAERGPFNRSQYLYFLKPDKQAKC